MGSEVGAGWLLGLRGLLGIVRLLVPILEADAEDFSSLPTQGQARSPLPAQEPPAVGPLDPKLIGNFCDGGGSGRAKFLGTDVHTPTIVPIPHSVNRAPFRVVSVARTAANLTDPHLVKAVGARFKSECKNLQITQEWLESVTGVPRTSIGRFQGGKRGIKSDGLVLVLAKAAERGVSLDFVFTGRRSPADAVIKALGDPEVVEGLRRIGATTKTGST
jgi:hypothetical protein